MALARWQACCRRKRRTAPCDCTVGSVSQSPVNICTSASAVPPSPSPSSTAASVVQRQHPASRRRVYVAMYKGPQGLDEPGFVRRSPAGVLQRGLVGEGSALQLGAGQVDQHQSVPRRAGLVCVDRPLEARVRCAPAWAGRRANRGSARAMGSIAWTPGPAKYPLKPTFGHPATTPVLSAVRRTR